MLQVRECSLLLLFLVESSILCGLKAYHVWIMETIILDRSLSFHCGCVLSYFSLSDSLQPMHSSPPGSSVHGFSRQEHCSGLPCPPPEDLPDPGIKPNLLCLLHWQAGSLPLVPPGKQHGWNLLETCPLRFAKTTVISSPCPHSLMHPYLTFPQPFP